MKVGRTIALVAALAMMAGTSVLAFQEQPAAGAPAEKSANAPAAQSTEPKTIDFGSAAAPAKSEGTEVNIPGLGKLGVLPKMDFGLELLYGASDSKNTGADDQPAPSEGDVTIRGSVKHKF